MTGELVDGKLDEGVLGRCDLALGQRLDGLDRVPAEVVRPLRLEHDRSVAHVVLGVNQDVDGLGIHGIIHTNPVPTAGSAEYGRGRRLASEVDRPIAVSAGPRPPQRIRRVDPGRSHRSADR
jgi:hypothetical protein